MCIKKELRFFYEHESVYPSGINQYDITKRTIYDYPLSFFKRDYPSLWKKIDYSSYFSFDDFELEVHRPFNYVIITYKRKKELGQKEE